MSVCQGRRKIILDTLDVEVSAFQFCMLSWAVVNQPGASNSTDLQSVLQRQLLGLGRGGEGGRTALDLPAGDLEQVTEASRASSFP